MANPTTNFGWVMPTSTDLVTDLPADFAVFGQGVDTTLADLKGGTTGQVLTKASNTDMDFTWAADQSGIPATILDAKGDLIAATAADTASRLAVGTNGQVLTADSTAATGLKWATPSSGSMTLLASGALGGNNITSVTGLSTSYKKLYIQLQNYTISTSGVVEINFNSDTSNLYQYSYISGRVNTVYYSGESAGSLWANPAGSISTGTNYNSFALTIENYADTTSYKIFNGCYQILNTTNYSGAMGGSYRSTSAISAVRFKGESTYTLTGNYYIYGVN